MDEKRGHQVERLSLMEIVDRMPPFGVHLIVALGPTIDLLHRLVMLVTWRGGHSGAIASWVMLAAYVLICMYGYEVLRYAPQALPLAWIGYTWFKTSVARVAGRRNGAGDAASVPSINRTLAQLGDLSDFVAAVNEGLFRPLAHLLSWNGPLSGTGAVAVFLLASWPLWLMCMLPPRALLVPAYTVSTTVSRIYGSAPVMHVRSVLGDWAAAVQPRVHAYLEENSSAMLHALDRATHVLRTTVLPAGCAVVHRVAQVLGAGEKRVSLQLLPPFPIASLSMRHVFLVVGCVALTWCAPWAKLVRMAIWRSAFVRRGVCAAVRVLSGSETMRQAWQAARPAPVSGRTTAATQRTDKGTEVREYETLFRFRIYENQRWWIGLDWTAALLPQERPSWSDEHNHAVSPPSSFTLPRTSSTVVPSSRSPGRYDVRTSEWRWVDLEWTVAGANFINSTVYTLASGRPAAGSPRSSERKGKAEEAAAVAAAISGQQHTDAVDRHNEEVHSAAKGGGDDASGAPPEELNGVAQPDTGDAAETTDVDKEGWQYGDNTWDKLSKQSGIGRYTRRRCWVRRAVLVQRVEYGVTRKE